MSSYDLGEPRPCDTIQALHMRASQARPSLVLGRFKTMPRGERRSQAQLCTVNCSDEDPERDSASPKVYPRYMVKPHGDITGDRETAPQLDRPRNQCCMKMEIYIVIKYHLSRKTSKCYLLICSMRGYMYAQLPIIHREPALHESQLAGLQVYQQIR